MDYLFIFLSAAILAYVLTKLVRQLAWRFNVVDNPEAASRKVHRQAIPLLGGVGVFIAWLTVSSVIFTILNGVVEKNIAPKHFIGIVLAGLILMIGGFLDDKFDLPPSRQIIFPIIAVALVIAAGVGITSITNPFGSIWHLDQLRFVVLWFNGWPYRISVWADLLTFFWLLSLMYNGKFLDGLDGLLAGTSVIGFVMIAFLSLRPEVAQSITAALAMAAAGAFSGFLILNWHPAKIFLGESGSMIAGFLLGVFSILSGSKIATTLLVMGLPLIDAVWVVISRLLARKSIFKGDQRHLHYRLLNLGWPIKKIVLLYYAISLAFGLSALLFSRQAKVISLMILFALVIFLECWAQVKVRDLPQYEKN